MTQIRTERARRPRLALSADRSEQVRTAAETMAVGVLFALFSLPVVTAGAAWCAAAEVTAAWRTGREPGLLRTFARVVARDLPAGLLVECAVLGPLAATWFEVHVVLRSRMPGYLVEAAALVLLGAAAVAFVLLTAGCRASQAVVAAGRGRAGAPWGPALRVAAGLVCGVPSTLVLVVTGAAFTVALVAVVPAFAAFMAGPLAFAVSAVVARAERMGAAAGGTEGTAES
jgi:hypothetical protein